MAAARVRLRFSVRRYRHRIRILRALFSSPLGWKNQILTFVLPRIKNPQQFGVVLSPGDTVDQFFKRIINLHPDEGLSNQSEDHR